MRVVHLIDLVGLSVFEYIETVKILHQVQKIQEKGLHVFFTIDAGPQVKLICDPSDTQLILEQFESMHDISKKIVTKVGGEPRIERLT